MLDQANLKPTIKTPDYRCVIPRMPSCGETSNEIMMVIPSRLKFGVVATRLHIPFIRYSTRPTIGILSKWFGAQFILQQGTAVSNSANTDKDSAKSAKRIIEDRKFDSRVEVGDTNAKAVVSGKEEVMKITLLPTQHRLTSNSAL